MGKLTVNWLYVTSCGPEDRGNLQFQIIPDLFLLDQARWKKVLSFHLINTRSGGKAPPRGCGPLGKVPPVYLDGIIRN